MRWNDQQRNALDVVHKRIAAGEEVTRLFGYAGTGKTTLAKELASGVGGNVVFAAFTGKAASVLTRKGCPAQTIHSLIYKPAGSLKEQLARLEAEMEVAEARGASESVLEGYTVRITELRKQLKGKKGKELAFAFNPELSVLGAMWPRPELLVLDEVSMVDDAMAKDLLSFGIPILALGDPAQLPPVGKGGYFTKGGEERADALLTTVERHDGPVIELATRVREGKISRLRPDGRLVVSRIGQSRAAMFDQVLVGKNSTRWAKNTTLRRLAGMPSGQLVAPGERIICLGNNKELRCMNGQQFGVLDVREHDYNPDMIEARLICECPQDDRNAYPGWCPTCGWESRWVPLWLGGFEGSAGEEEMGDKPYGVQKGAMMATYGYAITCHKSQGSEWGRVLVVDEAATFRRDGWRWLYTAITRAQSEVVVLR